MNAIIGFSDMMRSEVFGPLGSPRYAEYAELIRNSGLHLVDLISDLLDMSKIEAGKMTIDARLVDLKPLFEECVGMVSGAAEKEGVELRVEIAEGTPAIMADRRALKQSLINLLSNAIKFTLSEGRVVLSARAEGGNLWLRVADTGVGIPEKDLHRIGRPFEQVEGDMQRLHKGTGLGPVAGESVGRTARRYDGNRKRAGRRHDGDAEVAAHGRQRRRSKIRSWSIRRNFAHELEGQCLNRAPGVRPRRAVFFTDLE